MSGTRTARYAGLLLVMTVLAGCTASNKWTPVRPMDTDLSPYSSVVISVESLVDKDVEKEMSDLEYRVADNITELGLFRDVSLGGGSGAGEGTLLVRISIKKIKRVSGMDRFMGGALAGKASMTTDVLFIDAATGKELGLYTVTGKSGGTGLSGGTSDAVRETAECVASVIAENYPAR